MKIKREKEKKNKEFKLNNSTINPTERVERVNNAYGTSGDVIVVSNHINAGGGDGHCVTNIKYNNSNYRITI